MPDDKPTCENCTHWLELLSYAEDMGTPHYAYIEGRCHKCPCLPYRHKDDHCAQHSPREGD